MNVFTEYPRRVRMIANQWIDLSDGCRLAARIWLPEDADREPVPAILDYNPYRKDDGTAIRDAGIHPYFAGHGYASVRVDLRGSGDSDGVLEDEYLPREQADALEVLRWLAAQPWCTGAVGIIGVSWGGFNALQIAAHDPPELRAIISLNSTDDRYSDDVHYMGGCVLAWDMLPWASTMLAYNARPPDPAVVGEHWRSQWLDRIERTPPFIHAWLAHQRRDDYWKQGSVCEDYAAITCPVLMVGGWSDAYHNAALRFLENHRGFCQGLIGPWGHRYPHEGAPGPAIGFLQEAVRWWDQWLKGIDTGIANEPRLRMWLQDAVVPQVTYPVRAGRWISDPVTERRWLGLGDGTLGAGDAGAAVHDWHSAQTVGVDAGVWCGWGGPTDFPADQRGEDGRSLAFTSAVLREQIEIVGAPSLRVRVAVDRPQAVLAVRMCDVWPDGRSTLVTRGFLNLTHRDSHELPAPLEPERPYDLVVVLGSIAYVVPAGHRLRLALSSTYWPWIWPAPHPVTLRVHSGPKTGLELPIRSPAPDYQPPGHFGQPLVASRLRVRALRRSSTSTLQVRREVDSGALEIVNDIGWLGPVRFLDSELDYVVHGRDVYSINEDDPLSARVRCERSIGISRGDWRTRVETVSTLSSTASVYHVTNALDAYHRDVRVCARTWDASIPRDFT